MQATIQVPTLNQVPNTSAKSKISSIVWNRKKNIFQEQKHELSF
jgi:hypothetical protein